MMDHLPNLKLTHGGAANPGRAARLFTPLPGSKSAAALEQHRLDQAEASDRALEAEAAELEEDAAYLRAAKSAPKPAPESPPKPAKKGKKK